MNDSRRYVTRRVAIFAALTVCAGAACTNTSSRDTNSVTLLAYDSFVVPDDAFDSFSASTGVDVEIALGGDAGELVAKASLTSGNPEGDVLWGVDNALLTRLIEAEALEPYVSDAAAIDPSLIESARGVVTPVDYGFVCINYDIEALRERGVDPPSTLEDLARSEYRSMLVVPDATSSSPGLAFLLASVVAFSDSWIEFWSRLVANDVAIANGWTEAYYTRFTRHGGDRPLVVSYSTSPPAEVLLADPPLADGSSSPTAVAVDTCFRQIEYAAILRGAQDVDAARQLVDFLVGREFQELLPENLFVYPVNTSAVLPESFARHSTPITRWFTMDPDEISTRRVELLDEWSSLVGR